MIAKQSPYGRGLTGPSGASHCTHGTPLSDYECKACTRETPKAKKARGV